MFNFKPKIEVQKQESEDTVIEKQVIQKENRKNFLTPEIIKKIYEKGRLYILYTAMSLGMFSNDNSITNVSYDNFVSKFKNIPAEKNQEIFNDLNKILEPQEFSQYLINETEDSIISTAMLNDSARKVLIKLSSMFEFKSFDIDVNFGHNEDEQEINEIENKNLWGKIKEIREEFPLGYKPHISSLPYSHIDYLNSEMYTKGLKRLSALGMTTDVNYCNKEVIIKVAMDNSFYELLKKLNNLGPRFNINVVDKLSISGPCPEGFDSTMWEQQLNIRTNLETFIKSGENRKVFKYCQNYNTELDLGELQDLAYDSSGRYLKFFEDDKNQKSIQFLYKHGYDFRFMLVLLRSKREHMINEPAFLDVLTQLEIINSKSNSHSILYSIIDRQDAYYNFDTKEGFEQLGFDLNKIRRKLDEKFNNLDVVVEKLDDLQLIKDKKRKINLEENILNPLGIISFEMNGKLEGEDEVQEFLKDPAVYIVTKLGYQENPPKYFDHFNESLRADWIMRVARNMYITKVPITPQNFEQTFYEIVGLRMDKELLQKSLFKDRNVAFFAHNEKWGDDTSMLDIPDFIKGNSRFGKPAMKNAILNQKPSNLSNFKAENSKESLSGTKKNFLDYITNHSNLTILVDAHGGPDDIFLTQGLPNTRGLINSNDGWESSVDYYEMAHAFELRYDKGIKDSPIIIMSTCYNQNFVRNLCQEILEINLNKNKEIPLPITMGEAEYGQVAYSTVNNDFGSYFFETIFKNNTDIKLKDLMQLEISEELTNLYMFVPFTKESKDDKSKKIKQKVFYQITRNIGTSLDKTFALEYAENLINKEINQKTASYWEYTHPDWAREIKYIVKNAEESTG